MENYNYVLKNDIHPHIPLLPYFLYLKLLVTAILYILRDTYIGKMETKIETVFIWSSLSSDNQQMHALICTSY